MTCMPHVPGLSCFYMTGELERNLSMLIVIAENRQSFESFAELPTPRMRMPAEKAKFGGPLATTVTSREPTNDDLIVSQQHLYYEQRFPYSRTDRSLPRLIISSSSLELPALKGQAATLLKGWLVLVLPFLELLFELFAILEALPG